MPLNKVNLLSPLVNNSSSVTPENLQRWAYNNVDVAAITPTGMLDLRYTTTGSLVSGGLNGNLGTKIVFYSNDLINPSYGFGLQGGRLVGLVDAGGAFSLRTSIGGADVVRLNNDGNISGRYVDSIANSGSYLDMGVGTAGIIVMNRNTGHVPLTVRAAVSQVSNIQEWQNSSSTVLATVRSDGHFGVGTSNPIAPIEVSRSNTSDQVLAIFTNPIVSSLSINSPFTTGSYAPNATAGDIVIRSDTGALYLTGGAVALGSTSAESFRVTTGGAITVSSPTSLSGTNTPFKITSPATSQGLTSGITLYSTFTGTADNGPRRTVDIVAGYSGGAWGNEYLAFNVGTGAQNDAGNLTTERMRIFGLGAIKFSAALAEAATVSATAAATTVTYDTMTNKNVLYYTSNATANWTFNVRGNSTTALNTIMDNGQSLTVVFMNTNGTTAYYPTAFQIDGTSVTPKWANGSAPSAGNASSIDVYTYNIIKTATNTYTVLASQSRFA